MVISMCDKKELETPLIDEGCPISMELDHKKQCVVLNYSSVFLEDYDRYMEHLIKNIDWCIKKSFQMVDTDSP